MKRVVIDTDRCTGHGRCYALAPSVFDADDRGLGVVIAESLDPALEADAAKAVANCPEGAITIEG